MASCKTGVCLGRDNICKNCIKEDVCKIAEDFYKQPVYGMCIEDCDYFKDRNRFVELPCKVGDTIYEITERKRNGKWNKVIVERVVNGIEIGRGGFMTIRSGTTITAFLPDLGETVFLTREEAEQALRESENNG